MASTPTPPQPVVLVSSRHEFWAAQAKNMIAELKAKFPHAHIEHFGSTSVPDLPAKDVVDLLVGVRADRIIEVARALAGHGFDLEGEYAHHCWLSLPTRDNREFIIHVVEHDGRAWQRRIAFRDLLRTNANARAQYLAVKEASAQGTDNWDDYTQSKTSVVMELLDGPTAN